jgi:hypothetical protein
MRSTASLIIIDTSGFWKLLAAQLPSQLETSYCRPMNSANMRVHILFSIESFPTERTLKRSR